MSNTKPCSFLFLPVSTSHFKVIQFVCAQFILPSIAVQIISWRIRKLQLQWHRIRGTEQHAASREQLGGLVQHSHQAHPTVSTVRCPRLTAGCTHTLTSSFRRGVQILGPFLTCLTHPSTAPWLTVTPYSTACSCLCCALSPHAGWLQCHVFPLHGSTCNSKTLLYLPLTESGAVVDFMASRALIHCLAATVDTRLLWKQEAKGSHQREQQQRGDCSEAEGRGVNIRL